jgi:hypothetical protein
MRPPPHHPDDPLLVRARELLDLTPGVLRGSQGVLEQSRALRASNRDLRLQMANLVARIEASRTARRPTPRPRH